MTGVPPTRPQDDAETAVAVAVAVLEEEGENALNPRRLTEALAAASTTLPAAWTARDVLVAAITDEIALRMLASIDDTFEHAAIPLCETAARVRCLADGCARFSLAHPVLYRTLMAEPRDVFDMPKRPGHAALRDRVVEVLTPLTGEDRAATAALALWALLHGMWHLRRTRLGTEEAWDEALRFGIDTFVAGAARA